MPANGEGRTIFVSVQTAADLIRVSDVEAVALAGSREVESQWIDGRLLISLQSLRDYAVAHPKEQS